MIGQRRIKNETIRVFNISFCFFYFYLYSIKPSAFQLNGQKRLNAKSQSDSLLVSYLLLADFKIIFQPMKTSRNTGNVPGGSPISLEHFLESP
jgi:hypothetical protein